MADEPVVVEDVSKPKRSAILTPPEPEPEYSALDIIGASRPLFGVKPEVVVGALVRIGRPTYLTVAAAKAALDEFLRTKRGT